MALRLAVLDLLIRSRNTPTAERVFNVLLALSVLSWAVLGLTTSAPVDRLTPVRLTISALHVCIAWLLLFRAPCRRGGSAADILASLPALIISGAAFKLGPAPADWPWLAQSLFVGGGVLAIVSLLTLGRSFAILPAVRGVVTGGPFAYLRHPATAGETLMVVACLVAAASPWVLAFGLAVVPLVMLRIHAEERLLDSEPNYRAYRRRVPWRLVPLLW